MADNERDLAETDKIVIMHSKEYARRIAEIDMQHVRAFWRGKRVVVHDAAPVEGVYALQPVRDPAS